MVSCVGLAFGTEKSKGRNLEALQAICDGTVHETELKFLEAANENFRSVEQWELLIHRCCYGYG